MDETIQYMDSLRQAAPIHRMEIECYHYEYHHRRNSKGHTSTSRRKVVTYREYREFIYDRWIDESYYPDLPSISANYPLVAVDMPLIVAPGDDFTLAEFDRFRMNMIAENRFRDQFIHDTVHTDVPGHKSEVTAKSANKDEVPWWLNCGLFYFLAILFC